MNSFKKAVFVVLCCSVMIFNMLPLQAFCADTYYQMKCAEPYVSNHSGYIVFEFTQSSGYASVQCFMFMVSPIYADTDSEGNRPSSILDSISFVVERVEGNRVYYSVTSDSQVNFVFTAVTIYKDGKANYTTPVIVNSGYYTSSFSAGGSGTTITAATCVGPIDGGGFGVLPSCNVLWSDDIIFYNQFIEIISKLSTLVANDEEKIDALNDIISNLNTLISNTDEIEGQLDVANSFLEFIRDYVKVYLPEISEVLWFIDNDILIVQEKLDKIIDLLQPDTEVNVSTVDPSNFNEYNKAEQSLLDTSNVDVSNALKVEVDQNALLFIWPLVEQCLNSHPQVIGLVFTILSISIVALVLGRGH